MGGNGKAEPAIQQLGELVKVLRQDNHLSQEMLYSRFLDELLNISPIYHKNLLEEVRDGRQWMSRLECGNTVILSLGVIEALSRALECSSYERAKLYAIAGRNPLTPLEGNPSELVILLIEHVEKLYLSLPAGLEEFLEEHLAAKSDRERTTIFTKLVSDTFSYHNS